MKTKSHQDEVPTIDEKQQYTASPALFFLGIFVAGLIGFGLGSGVQFTEGVFQKTVNKDQLNLAAVQQTYQELKKNYDGTLDPKKLEQGASRGLVAAAGDQYTVYFDKKEAEEFDSDLEGSFQGIGAELDKKDGKLVVVSPLKDSPAERAGLKSKDVIARVNDDDTTDWSIDKAVSKIRGKEGTTVKLTILRDTEVKEISIVRATITTPSVTSEIRGQTGIITMSRFSTDTASLTRKAANDFKKANVTGVVLDLRGNGGGYLETAQEVSSLWLKQGQAVVEERRGSEVIDTHRASGEAILEGVPTVVLVNEGSASASEIVAGALQENDAAKLVGMKTFGKGSVQTIVDLKDGAKLKVTIAKWYTPKGKNISKHGISPDVEVKALSTDTRDNDTQLNKALELLK